MKCKTLCIALLLTGLFANAQKDNTTEAIKNESRQQSRLNIYVISKGKKFEFFPFTVKVRAFTKSIFNRKKMRVIVAGKSEYAAAKIEKLLKKHNAVIGNLWFDSHGLYKNGFSSFSIGEDNFNYKNINDTTHNAFLRRIALHTDDRTKIGLGSCYAGASFTFPGSATAASGPMYGDSLMIGVGNIFSGSTIYASESWVMMKPGIFADKFGFAGYPLGKRYKKLYWKPAWDHLGEWHSYSTKDELIKNINTVALTHTGEINVRSRNYLSLSKAIRKQDRALATLQP
jgi:hypothetical protein